MTFNKQWGWYNVLDNLSNNDRTKWDFFLDMPIREFLNTLMYYKDKQYMVQQEMKRQQIKYGR